MRYWWVNQNQTYKYEVPGGFLWSPKTNSNGARNQFYDNMNLTSPGDLVFSFCDTYIRAIGVVQKSATESPKPDFEGAGMNWSNSGWQVEVEFWPIDNPVRPKDLIKFLEPHLPTKYSPLQLNGNGIQSVYLAEISRPFAEILVNYSHVNLPLIEHELAPSIDLESDAEIELEIQAKQIEGDLEKIQLVKARRGQGIYKHNVRLVEGHCRITNITLIKHLRASHIKPWKDSNDMEKIDGYNGLLLAPHIDHLFDQGFISFEEKGELIISDALSRDVVDKWDIPFPKNVGGFRELQLPYLDYHRANIFKSA
jgi:hypothetical protein